MKKTLALLFLIFSVSLVFGLNAGDIAIIGIGTDATDSYSFVALVDISNHCCPVKTIMKPCGCLL